MRIGSQRNVITVQRRIQMGANAMNEPNFVWQDWREDVFCEVTVKRGKEWFDPVGLKRLSEDVWQFRTRYDEVLGIDQTMQIAHEGQFFDIKAVLPDGQKHNDCIIEAVVQDGALGGGALMGFISVQIPSGIVGVPFDGLPIEINGGLSPYVVTSESGSLPPGLEIDGQGIVGTPVSAGTFNVPLQITDAAGTVENMPVFEIVIAST